MLVLVEHSPVPDSSAHGKKMNTHELAGSGELNPYGTKTHE
jgi:hypothetical protein